jgi:ABC-type multidrug transport system fused ATPase/permease subunit
MFRIRENEFHLARARDVRHARMLASFFLRRALVGHKWVFVCLILLAGLLVLGQIGFILVLDQLIVRLQGGQFPELPSKSIAFFPELPSFALVLLVFGSLVLLASASFFAQQIAARLNIKLLRTLMREVTLHLVRMREGSDGGLLLSPKSATNLYTKDCRYAALIVYRTLSAIPPLTTVPFLVAFCLWLSPLLSGVGLAALAIMAPLHFLLMRRGLVSMRGLLSSSVSHSSSKKTLLKSLLEFPAHSSSQLEPLQKAHVDQGSKDFLHYYFQRRMLAAYSSLLNFLAIAVAVGLASAILLMDIASIELPLPQIVLFIVALRFLLGGVGQIITNATTVFSLAPLCETLYRMLTYTGGTSRRSTPAPFELGPDEQSNPVPRATIISDVPITPGVIRALLLSAQPNRKKALRGLTFVRPRYPALFKDLQRDLLLPAGWLHGAAAAEGLPPHINDMIVEALQREAQNGWSEDLWQELSDSVRLYATLRAALARSGQPVVLVGPIAELVGLDVWADLKARIADRKRIAVHLLDSLPKRFSPAEGAELFVFDGETLIEIDTALSPAVLRQQVTSELQNAAERASRRNHAHDADLLPNDEEEVMVA